MLTGKRDVHWDHSPLQGMQTPKATGESTIFGHDMLLDQELLLPLVLRR
jgi:hypothetical protein